MSKVIRFLESVGAAPALLPEQYSQLVSELDVMEEQRDALVARNAAVLGELLGGRAVMRCAIFEPQREPDREPDQQSPGEGGEEPDSTADGASQAA